MRWIKRIAERFQHRHLDTIRAVWNRLSRASGLLHGGPVPGNREKRSRRAVPAQELLEIGEAGRLAGCHVDDLHRETSNLMIEMEHDERDIAALKCEGRTAWLVEQTRSDELCQPWEPERSRCQRHDRLVITAVPGIWNAEHGAAIARGERDIAAEKTHGVRGRRCNRYGDGRLVIVITAECDRGHAERHRGEATEK